MNAFLKIGIVALISAALAQGVYMMMEKGREKFFSTTTPRFNEILAEGKSHDILMLGSSRTYLHNDPRIIDSITGLDSYNAGVQGGSLLEINMILDGYLQNHGNPHLIVLETSMLSFNVDKSFINNPTLYFRYLNNKGVSLNLDEYWKQTVLFRYLPFLRLTEFDDLNRSYAFKGFAGQREVTYGNVYKGYSVNDTAVIKDTIQVEKHGCEWVRMNQRGKYFLQKIINTCRERKIPIVAIYSPEYKKLNYLCPEGRAVMDTITSICKANNTPFWNYLNNPICFEKKAFLNISHLNKYGAEKFSAILGNDLRDYLSK